jgi:ATP-dependent protease ClpP protease subunit
MMFLFLLFSLFVSLILSQNINLHDSIIIKPTKPTDPIVISIQQNQQQNAHSLNGQRQNQPQYIKTFKSITLEPNNFIAVVGSINSVNVNMWIRNISSIENQKIYVYINSNGGSVEAGQKLIDQFAYLQQKGIIIECVAQNAYSMAFQILQSCDKRYITPSATVMQHQMSVSELGGQFENLLNYLTMIKQMSNDLDTIAAKRIGISYTDYKLKTSTDWWLYGEEIIRNNVADEIVYVGCGKKLYETFNYKEKVDFDVTPDGYLELKKTKSTIDLCPL